MHFIRLHGSWRPLPVRAWVFKAPTPYRPKLSALTGFRFVGLLHIIVFHIRVCPWGGVDADPSWVQNFLLIRSFSNGLFFVLLSETQQLLIECLVDFGARFNESLLRVTLSRYCLLNL